MPYLQFQKRAELVQSHPGMEIINSNIIKCIKISIMLFKCLSLIRIFNKFDTSQRKIQNKSVPNLLGMNKKHEMNNYDNTKLILWILS